MGWRYLRCQRYKLCVFQACHEGVLLKHLPVSTNKILIGLSTACEYTMKVNTVTVLHGEQTITVSLAGNKAYSLSLREDN